MNNKGNLLTKKKYKIVNQKGGIMEYWTFCVEYNNYFLNRFSEKYFTNMNTDLFIPFNIKIVKYSWPGGIRGNHYYMTNDNGVVIPLELDETNFVKMLLNPTSHANEHFTLGLTEKFGTTYYKYMCLLYHIAFFEECIPEPFIKLHEIVLSAIKDSFFRIYDNIEIKINNLVKLKENATFKNMIKLNTEEGFFGVFMVYETHPYFYVFALFNFINSEYGKETMQNMKKIKDNYGKKTISVICKEITKNSYCPVFTRDVNGTELKPFIYDKDTTHAIFVNERLNERLKAKKKTVR